MYCNVINSYRHIVAVCDKELLGKIFEEGNMQLNVKENFYSGEDKKIFEEKELVELLRNMRIEDATFNIVGEKSINTAIKAGIINENAVGEISGIKFALVLI